MALRPEVFLSAAIPEMSTYRSAAKKALLEIGVQAVVQDDFNIEYGQLHGAICTLLRPCEAIIHLLGFTYGAEPPERTLHAPRRSFVQYEVDVARQAGKTLYVFALEEPASDGPTTEADDEAKFLQAQHRRALLQFDLERVVYIHSPEELAQHIRALRPKLVVRRSLARLPARPLAGSFIGRRRLLEELALGLSVGRVDVLHPHGDATPPSGQGKTCAAIEAAWRLHDSNRFDFVFWIAAGPRADMDVSLAALARTDSLSLLPDEVASHKARYDAVIQWLSAEAHADRWLMIIDGVDDENIWWSVRTLLPLLQKGAVLLTSSRTAWLGLQCHTIGGFSPEHARDYFAGSLAKGSVAIPAELQALDRLSDCCGRFPLGLSIVSAFLREEKISARDFISKLEREHKSASGEGGLTPGLLLQQAIRALDVACRSTLAVLCCLDAQPHAIPLALFEHRGDWPQQSSALEALHRRALITRDESGQTVSVHRTVREMTRDLLSSAEMNTALGTARAELESVLQRSSGPRSPSLTELLIPHCRVLLGQLNGHPLELYAGPIAGSLGDWLRNSGRLGEAETFYRRYLAIEERRLGVAHEDLAPRLRDLVSLLRSASRLAAAEELSTQLLQMHHSASQKDAALYVADVIQHASILRAQNRLADAEASCRAALRFAEQVSGSNHPRVALVLHHLAGVLESANRLREAEGLYRRALAVEERTFGSDHPRLLTRIYHLGMLLANLAQSAEAETLLGRGLAIDEAKLGRNHPDLIPVLETLAGIREKDGRLAEAEEISRRILQLAEQNLGTEHVETGVAHANLGCILEESGNLEAALEHFTRCAAVFSNQGRRLRGPHPQLAPSLVNLGRVLARLAMSKDETEKTLSAFRHPMPRRVRSRFLDDE